MSTKSKAVVLLSGGLDSSTVLGIAISDRHQCFPLAVDYRQRHRKELDSAMTVAAYYRGRHGRDACETLRIVDLRFPTYDGSGGQPSALLGTAEVPVAGGDGIPVTYVPGRNAVFIALAVSYAETVGARYVYLGVNAVDYSGYPDCRPAFIRNLETALNLGTKCGIEGNGVAICTPIIHKNKVEIIRTALELGVPLHHTWSCYKGEAKPCGVCDSCVIRAKAFAEAGERDPALK